MTDLMLVIGLVASLVALLLSLHVILLGLEKASPRFREWVASWERHDGQPW